MKHHPYTNVWPMLDDDAFKKFKTDIAAHGQRLPVLTYQDMVLDGRNRERACEELGVATRYEDSGATSDAEALAVVISYNEHRRHLSENQRALAALAIVKLIEGGNLQIDKLVHSSKELEAINAEHKTTSRRLAIVAGAHKMNVTGIRIARLEAVEKHGGQAALDEVFSGKISLTDQCAKVVPKRERKEKAPKRARPGRPRKDEKRPQGTIPPVRTAVPLPRAKPPGSLDPAGFTGTIEEWRKLVDPEFTGTAIEFTDKYGHVQAMTAEQYATERFGAWALNMGAVSKEAKRLPDWPDVDYNWLRSPRARDIAKMTEAVDYLRPKLAEAEALLARAQEAQKPAEALHQPDAESLLTE